MKNFKGIFTAVVLSLSGISSVNAMSTSELACGAILCLAGDGGSACNPYLNAYNKIKVYSLDGGISKKATEKARKKFLDQCKHVSSTVVNPKGTDIAN